MTFGSLYIAGHRGLVGSALLRDLQKDGYRNIIVRTHNELDLRNACITRAHSESARGENAASARSSDLGNRNAKTGISPYARSC